MIEDFKQKLNSKHRPLPTNAMHSCCGRYEDHGPSSKEFISSLTSTLSVEESTTPPGSPPPNPLASLNNARSDPAPPALPVSIAGALATLKNIAQQNLNNPRGSSAAVASASTTPAPAPAPAPVSAPYATSGSHNAIAAPSFMNTSQPGLGLSYAQISQPAVPTAGAPATPFLPPQAQPAPLPNYSAQNAAPSLMNGVPGATPAVPAGGADPTALQVALIQQLIQKGLPPDQIAAVVKALAANNAAPPNTASQAPQLNQGAFPMSANGNGNGWAPPRSDDRDLRSPTTRARGRSRSRSPGRHWDQRDSPRGRDDHRFGEYGRNSPPRDRFDDRDRSRPYRQRSPPGRHGSSPRRGEMPAFQQEKFLQYEPSLPPGHIKVMSRTLFVGGVTCSEAELRSMFNRFGAVQTCIVNKEKRHAFVKMYSRKDAVSAKEAMEDGRSPDAQLRTRWGVGFGPRDCSDYQTGVSVIPIQKLTEADRKWMLTAPYGGSGGKPISHGMVVEEPDIEIGAGVSSKAISRRMQTDKGGSHGPKSTHHREVNSSSNSEDRNDRRHGRRGGGGRDHGHRREEDRSKNSNPNHEPVAPGFGFGISTDQNGMPVFPPGFVFPAPDAINNPPY